MQLAREAGRRLGELGIPVYLYEKAAATPARRNLAVVRAGEYEGLEKKLAEMLNSPNHRWFIDKMDPTEREERRQRQEEFKLRYAK